MMPTDSAPQGTERELSAEDREVFARRSVDLANGPHPEMWEVWYEGYLLGRAHARHFDAGAAPAEREGLQKAAERALAMLDAFNRLTFNIGVGREAREIAESLREALAAAPREQEPDARSADGSYMTRDPLDGSALLHVPEPPAPGEALKHGGRPMTMREIMEAEDPAPTGEAARQARQVHLEGSAASLEGSEAARLAEEVESFALQHENCCCMATDDWVMLRDAARLLRTLERGSEG